MPIAISWQGATLGANTFTGAQVAPSLALGGAALSGNALAVSGTIAADGGAGGGGLTYSAGNLTAAFSVRGINYVQGAIIIPDATGSILFGGGGSRASIKSSATGVIQVGLNAGTTGVSFDAATDGTLKLNNFANSAGAIVQAASLALGGASLGSNALAVIGASSVVADTASTANRAQIEANNVRARLISNWGTGSGVPLYFGAGADHWRIATDGTLSTIGGSGLVNVVDLVATSRVIFGNQGRLLSPSDGVIGLYNATQLDFNRLQFGGTGATYPAIARSGTTLKFRTADDLNDAPITASSGTFSGALSVDGTLTTYNNFNLGASRVVGWGNGSIGTIDTAFSRLGAGIIGIGTGAAGNAGGEIRAGVATFSGAVSLGAAIDGFLFTGGTGSGVLSMSGSSTNIGLNLRTKGNEEFNFQTAGGVTLARIGNSGASTNRFMVMAGGISGSSTAAQITTNDGPLWIAPNGGQVRILPTTGLFAGGVNSFGLAFSSVANFGLFVGSGAPTLSAAKGSLYLRSDGTGVADRMYVNTDASTTWTAVATVA